ncbi:hypothetical protein DH2020_037688 [Rehmannia glutinosa]|uniref:Disease resistance R13L4/SHOC-2-like LRR domain-containing protein n=1 Tax=Rehmannia glutinosa TaxID=99300 RepID=A0ABR0V1H4_REHGL
MGSYAALVSLKQTINRLPNSRHVSIQVAHKKIRSLKNIAERLNGSNESRVNAFDGQIREAACELEDTLELLVSNQNLSQPKKSLYPLLFPQVQQVINTFVLRAKELKKVFNEEIVNWLTEKDDVVPSRIEFDRKKHKNILFGIKDVYNSMASISTARSLLCTGLNHPYPVSICLGMRLLRVLDALTIPFYEFPIDQILNLVHLRYLALTLYNGNIPSFISKLWNLQFLIVRRHLSIKLYGSRSYLPIEIWDMKELKHLQIMGSDLPNPCDETPILKNLVTLLDVSARSFTKGVIKRIPNLKKLGIRIELELDSTEPLSCFHHISNLRRLESLKCIIVNPIVAPHVEPLPNFPACLTKLTLSGLGYPWEEMSTIALLPNLKVLKLRCYAFRGPKWEIYGEAFAQLEFLLIEDTDLVHWTVGDGGFPFLETVKLKHCYKLEEVPEEFRNSILTINLVDCNPLAVTCAKEIQKKMEQETGDCFAVMVQYSWDDKNPKPDY